MKKISLEHFRDNDFPKGYGYAKEPRALAKVAILDKLLEWSKDKNVTIYDYAVRAEDENISNTKFRYASERGLTQEECEVLFKDKTGTAMEHNLGMIYKIPLCSRVYYLDIWYQEK